MLLPDKNLRRTTQQKLLILIREPKDLKTSQ